VSSPRRQRISSLESSRSIDYNSRSKSHSKMVKVPDVDANGNIRHGHFTLYPLNEFLLKLHGPLPGHPSIPNLKHIGQNYKKPIFINSAQRKYLFPDQSSRSKKQIKNLRREQQILERKILARDRLRLLDKKPSPKHHKKPSPKPHKKPSPKKPSPKPLTKRKRADYMESSDDDRTLPERPEKKQTSFKLKQRELRGQPAPNAQKKAYDNWICRLKADGKITAHYSESRNFSILKDRINEKFGARLRLVGEHGWGQGGNLMKEIIAFLCTENAWNQVERSNRC